MSNAAATPSLTDNSYHGAQEQRTGMVLIFLSALFWSVGGAIDRFIATPDSWTVVFWRSLWASLSILTFILVRDGWRGAWHAFRMMGLPGYVVSVCLATSSTCFVVALAYTTVANVLLIQAGVPLLAALFGWMFFRERVSIPTWIAILAVIVGISVMVSDSFGGTVSPIGDGLALLIACAFAVATVITRRYAHVRMTPATLVGTVIAALFASTQAGTLATSATDAMYLFAFGALNLGLGMVFFAMGARLIPAAYAALIGCFEPILGPVWVWLVHGEEPSQRALFGGAIVVAALFVHVLLQLRKLLAAKPA